ncbi:MAG: hypothetical protein ACP5MD_02220 [Verrucomicrobiia bacterium]
MAAMCTTDADTADHQPDSTGKGAPSGEPIPAKPASGLLRTIAGRLALLIVSVTVCIAGAELVFRFFGMANPVLYRENPQCGYEPAPNQVSHRLGIAVHINDLGLRDDEKSSAFRDAKRILVVGDSVTFGGSRVRQQDLFTEVLERKINSSNRAPIKVLNAGVNGYSVTQMLNRAKTLIPIVKPDYMIVYAIEDDFHRPPLTFLAEGNFVYPTCKPSSALGQFILLSVHHMDKRYGFLKRLPKEVSHIWERPRNRDAPYDTNRVVDIHVEAITDFVCNSWESTGHPKENIMICIAPTVSALNANGTPQQSSISTMLARANLPVRDLTADFHSAVSKPGTDAHQYFWDEVHYVEKGNALAAEILFQHILQAGWIK